MESLIKENGSKVKDKDKERKYGQMEANISGNGKIIRLMDMEHYIMQMVIFIKDNGPTIKRVAKVHIHTKMEPNMSGNGKMISKMVMESSNG